MSETWRKAEWATVDEHTRFTDVMGLSADSDTPMAFELYKKAAYVKKYFNHVVVTLHSDEGGDYEKADTSETSQTTPNTPQHNPFAESANHTYLETNRAILEQSVLSARY